MDILPFGHGRAKQRASNGHRTASFARSPSANLSPFWGEGSPNGLQKKSWYQLTSNLSNLEDLQVEPCLTLDCHWERIPRLFNLLG